MEGGMAPPWANEMLRVGVCVGGCHEVPCAGAGLNPQHHWVVRASATELEGWSRTRPPGRHAAAVSLYLGYLFHSCWAMIRGEAWLSLIPAPLARQTAGRQTAG